jgi:hypothetical protein
VIAKNTQININNLLAAPKIIIMAPKKIEGFSVDLKNKK